MALAVKNTPEISAPSVLSRLPAASLVGMVYVLGCLGVVFYAVPALWNLVVAPLLPAGLGFVNTALLVLAMIAAAGTLLVVGQRLVGPRPIPGLKAGIFVAIFGLWLVAQMTQWIGFFLEEMFHGGMLKSTSPAIGAVVTAAIGGALAYLALRFFFQPATEKKLIQFEDQGWFSTSFYKRSQGLRVRRGTILGLLLLAGCGIYTLIGHGSLAAGAADWKFSIPFTGKKQVERIGPTDVVYVQEKGDSPFEAGMLVNKRVFDETHASLRNEKKTPPTKGTFQKDRFEFRDLPNHDVGYVAIDSPGDTEFQKGQVVSTSEFDKEKERLSKAGKQAPTAHLEADGPVVHAGLTILPSVKYTLPIVLALGALWLAFRMVNYPTFADFLIATEAEMNKVSWTSGKRLRQDTVVVLVTVLLLTIFLFLVDQLWAQILTRVGVLRFDTTNQQTFDPKEQPW